MPNTGVLFYLFALADSATPLDLAGLAQYGALGIVAATLFWFAKKMVDRETARADRLEAENARLNEQIASKVIPALMSATAAVEQSTEMWRDHQRRRGGPN